MVALLPHLVAIMSTPEEAVAGTHDYLYYCALGIPLIAAYNIIAAIFRGLGDTRSPMYFIAVACVLNIVLDYVFLGAVGMGPEGAAIATVIAQGVSVVISLFYIRRGSAGISVARSDFRPDHAMLHDILRIGVPIALQDGFIQISFLVITVIANMRGLTDAAAVGIVEKVISFLFLVPSSMLSTVSALGAQNVGAGAHDRVRQTLRYALGIAVGGRGRARALHERHGRRGIRRGLLPRLCHRLHLRGSPFLLQRVFLRLWPFGNLVHPQHHFDYLRAHPARVSRFGHVPADAAADGSRDRDGLRRFHRHLRHLLSLAAAPL